MARRNRLGEIAGNVFGFGLAVSALVLGGYWMFRHDAAPAIAVNTTFAIPHTIPVASFAQIDLLQPTPIMEVLETSRLANVKPGTHLAPSSSARKTRHHAHAAPAATLAASPPSTTESALQRLARADNLPIKAAVAHDAHPYCTAAALTRNICLPEAQLTGQ